MCAPETQFRGCRQCRLVTGSRIGILARLNFARLNSMWYTRVCNIFGRRAVPMRHKYRRS